MSNHHQVFKQLFKWLDLSHISEAAGDTIACWAGQKKTLTGTRVDIENLWKSLYMEYVKYLNFAYSSC